MTRGGADDHKQRWSRRQFFALSGSGLVAAAVGIPEEGGAQTSYLGQGASSPSFLSGTQRTTLSAAVARIVPANGPGDWSAADIGVVDYIDNLLSGFDRDPATGGIYPGGPFRLPSTGGEGFTAFRTLSEVKLAGWQRQVTTWRSLYDQGLAALDVTAGGSFAGSSSGVQDLILYSLDYEGSPFFSALFDHTMEGTYSHPVYGGNQGYTSWQWLGFAGDVHGVRFPATGSKGSWNTYGGYAPEEIAGPGTSATQQPVVTGLTEVTW